jgi:hypothetical protein
VSADLITLRDVYAELRTAIRAAGSEAAFARAHGLRRQDVNDASSSRRPPSPAVLAALGLVPVTRYVRRAATA